MAIPPVYIVHLRRPKSKNADPFEMRSDPFWEFGSFGCTSCHAKNLLHPKNIHKRVGARLAFAQGGPDGCRLVFLTPPITVHPHNAKGEQKEWWEAKWRPEKMPFRYQSAPKLAWNKGRSDFILLERDFYSNPRRRKEANFSSHFRSRTRPLENNIAEELIRVYEKWRRSARPEMIAASYNEAMASDPPMVDTKRRATYERFLTIRRDQVNERFAKCCAKGSRKGRKCQMC